MLEFVEKKIELNFGHNEVMLSALMNVISIEKIDDKFILTVSDCTMVNGIHYYNFNILNNDYEDYTIYTYKFISVFGNKDEYVLLHEPCFQTNSMLFSHKYYVPSDNQLPKDYKKYSHTYRYILNNDNGEINTIGFTGLVRLIIDAKSIEQFLNDLNDEDIEIFTEEFDKWSNHMALERKYVRKNFDNSYKCMYITRERGFRDVDLLKQAIIDEVDKEIEILTNIKNNI